MKKLDTKQWLETETKKFISETKKYHRDIQYKKELDYAVVKKILLMIPLVLIILSSNLDENPLSSLFGSNPSTQVKTNLNTVNLFPNEWVCPRPSCAYSNYDGISSCALCGTARP